MPKLKNSTSAGRNTFDKIQSVLASHGANKIMYDYAPDGTLAAITFGMTVGGKQIGFRLPALVENVFNILYPNNKEYRNQRYVKGWKEQAYKTAWANIRDWIDAQMALIDTEQVKMEQVFLPYMLDSRGQTLYENISNNQFKLLE